MLLQGELEGERFSYRSNKTLYIGLKVSNIYGKEGLIYRRLPCTLFVGDYIPFARY
jgi:hypothetical protein